MSSATAIHTLSTAVATAEFTRIPAEPAAPAAPLSVAEEDAIWKAQNARETRLLVKITGVSILILLVFFMVLVTILGSNGRTQRSYAHQHPVAPVTRLAK